MDTLFPIGIHAAMQSFSVALAYASAWVVFWRYRRTKSAPLSDISMILFWGGTALLLLISPALLRKPELMPIISVPFPIVMSVGAAFFLRAISHLTPALFPFRGIIIAGIIAIGMFGGIFAFLNPPSMTIVEPFGWVMLVYPLSLQIIHIAGLGIIGFLLPGIFFFWKGMTLQDTFLRRRSLLLGIALAMLSGGWILGTLGEPMIYSFLVAGGIFLICFTTLFLHPAEV